MARGSRVAQSVEDLLRSPRTAAIAVWAAVGIGVTLRLGAFDRRPSLWIDEAMLALNVATRSFLELLTPLEMGQLAPPLFLWGQRAAVVVGGVNETSLRVLPLIAGIGALVLFAGLAKRILSPAAAAAATLFVATSHVLIRYATEAKQYSSDALVTVMLLLPAWIICSRRASTTTWVCFAITLVIAPLLSFTAVFVMVGLVLTFTLVDMAPRERRVALSLCAAGAAVAAFTIVQVRSPGTSAYMQTYWESRFLPMDLAGVRALVADALDLARSGRFLPLDAQARQSVLSDGMEISTFATIANFTFLYSRLSVRVYVIASAALVALGIWSMIKRSGWRSLLLIAPLAAGLAANLVGAYPIAMRLWLFAAPLIVLLFVAGISAVAAWLSPNRAECLTVAAAIALELPVAITATMLFVDPITRREHSRPIVRTVRETRVPGEVVYSYPSSTPAWLMYSTGWEETHLPAVRAYLKEASPPNGAAFVNRREPHALSAAGERSLQRSTPAGVDVFGTSSGIVVEYRDNIDMKVFERWGDAEAERILRNASGCAWTFESHTAQPERDAVNSALSARGFAVERSVGNDNARATRFCPTQTSAPRASSVARSLP